MIKNKHKFNLKEKVINSFMRKGKKETSEKIIIRTLKKIQKLDKKNCKTQLQVAILNLTPTFKLNKQSKKRGKKKQMNYVPHFLPNTYLRIGFALKLLKLTIVKNKKDKTFEHLAKEILNSSNSVKSTTAIEQKNNLQKQVLSQKRYFYKFRW